MYSEQSNFSSVVPNKLFTLKLIWHNLFYILVPKTIHLDPSPHLKYIKWILPKQHWFKVMLVSVRIPAADTFVKSSLVFPSVCDNKIRREVKQQMIHSPIPAVRERSQLPMDRRCSIPLPI